MSNLEWLKEISNPGWFLSIAHQPHSCVVDGRPFAYATDGRMFVAIETDEAETLFSYQQNVLVDRLLRIERHGKIASFHALREWIGDDTLSLCPKCGGRGCVGHHDKCNGSGWTGDEQRYGLIEGVVINRCLAAKAFHHLDAADISVTTEVLSNGFKAVIFVGDNFRICVVSVVFTLRDDHHVDEFDAWLEP